MPDFQASPIFYETYDAITVRKARRIVHQGGQWSGKTVNILGVLATLACDEIDTVTTVTSESFPHLKAGALRDFERFVYPAFKPKIKNYNKTNHVFTFHKGAILEFKSYENEQSARGAKRNRLFVNEANTFDYLTFFQLDSRSDVSIIDYNPTAKFWAHDIIMPMAGTETLYSDHRHNPFLSKDRHQEIENIKDPELWRVYARGLTGNIMGVIYTTWKSIPDSAFPQNLDYFWGIDFGYTNDPTVIVRCCRIGERIYVDQVYYKSGACRASEIYDVLMEHGYKDDEPVYCEHDPDMIRQLREYDILSIAARKGKGSIKAGIEKIKEYEIYLTESSEQIWEERKRYVWMVDKSNGRTLNVPIDMWNHGMDAIRYAIYTHYFRDESDDELSEEDVEKNFTN